MEDFIFRYIYCQDYDRFKEDFEGPSVIEEGNFVTVFKGKHKTDKNLYAIKKVTLKNETLTMELYRKYLSEISFMSKLNNNYVMRYHTAWFELHALSSSESGDEVSEWVTSSDVSTESASYKEFDSVEDHYGDEKITLTPYMKHRLLIDNQLLVYIQMELYGCNLKVWLNNRNATPFLLNEDNKKTTRILARQLLTGLDYLHSNNIVHRNIQPSSLLLVQNGANRDLQLKIGDFSSAESLDNDGYKEVPGNAVLMIYGGPEECDVDGNNVKINSKCDMHAAGIVLMELMIKCVIGEVREVSKNIRSGIINEDLTVNWPIEAPIITDLISNTITKRPSAEFILRNTEAFIEKQPYAKSQRFVELNSLGVYNDDTNKENEPMTSGSKKRKL